MFCINGFSISCQNCGALPWSPHHCFAKNGLMHIVCLYFLLFSQRCCLQHQCIVSSYPILFIFFVFYSSAVLSIVIHVVVQLISWAFVSCKTETLELVFGAILVLMSMCHISMSLDWGEGLPEDCRIKCTIQYCHNVLQQISGTYSSSIGMR